MKQVLITGSSSYIGNSIEKWLSKCANYSVDKISVRDDSWKQCDFSKYDVVINVAGIAHINNITDDMKPLFYAVNQDLTIKICKQAKKYGVKHFVHFSSMNVYGDYCGHVTNRNSEHPTSFYGDSKLQGDLGIQKLADVGFTVSIIRPPFVYGKGCKGNYNTISKIAQLAPLFPAHPNRKSMIYIDNLCEFTRIVIENIRGGVFTPQNKELVSTADLVREIRKSHSKQTYVTRAFNWAIPIGCRLTRAVRRAFADDCYSLELSHLLEWKYCIVSFDESIRRTES